MGYKLQVQKQTQMYNVLFKHVQHVSLKDTETRYFTLFQAPVPAHILLLWQGNVVGCRFEGTADDQQLHQIQLHRFPKSLIISLTQSAKYYGKSVEYMACKAPMTQPAACNVTPVTLQDQGEGSCATFPSSGLLSCCTDV